jgi:Holliday junction resolvasome RuvABC endonuclease subunit
MDLDLTRFAGDGPAGPSRKKAWEFEPIRMRYVGTILAFDQTLGHTGYVVLDCREWREGRLPIIRHVGMIEPGPTGEKGHLDNLLKSEAIFAEVMALVKEHQPTRVAHESPPTGGGKLHRPESSLMAAQSLRLASRLQGVTDIQMIHAQSVKGRMTGNRAADKKDMHAVLYQEYVSLAATKPNNENTRDALGVGTLAAEKE